MAKNKDINKLDRDALLAMATDPVIFVKTCFGVTPTPQQESLLKAASVRGAKVSVRSGHGTGKTTSLAWLIHWFLLFHTDVKIPCTATTAAQLHDALWAELSKWHRRYLYKPFKDSIGINNDRMYIIGEEKFRFAVARTSAKDKPEALQGFHAENLMVIIDEASGVDNKVFEVAEGTLSTEGAIIILCSNPTRNSGYFYDTQMHPKIKYDWTRLAFNCLDSPIVTSKYVEGFEKKYGAQSNEYRVRVLGEFPELNDDSIISRSLIESAYDREVSYSSSPKIAGLDVARFGDDATAIVIRQGGKIIYIDQWKGLGIDESIGRVVALYRRGMFDRIYVDACGLGAGVADMLPVYPYNVPTIGVNVAEKASQSELYNRLRDELWFNAKEFFEEQTCSIDGTCKFVEELTDELCGPTYKYTSNGKLKVEGKDEMKARGVPSPNLADAFNLTLYNYSSPAQNRIYVNSYNDGYKSPNVIL
ncbi:hypothetical protein [Fundidesulfovibrio putealis]|uniref:hypothetical protein n=1 Tax=Fundidesulfovibrio putealis TaxID=270496 RepID=UPI0004132503|nr:hypothetical protein [Fundidesulfovibrio putealis]